MTLHESNGKQYETWLFVLLLIKGYGMQFQIGKEVKIGDKFDDVVLKYKSEDACKDNYIFCQVKLVDDGNEKVLDEKVLLGLKSISKSKTDFDLNKYFLSYLRIRDQFKRSGNVLSKLVIYSNVSDLDKDLKRSVETYYTDKFDEILKATKEARVFLKTNSKGGQNIVQKLRKIQTDWEHLINILLKYTNEAYAKKNPMTFQEGNPLSFYHTAMVDEKILQVTYETTGPICNFHENFIEKKNISAQAELFYNDLLEKSGMDNDSFKDSLMGINWKVWKSFGNKDKINTDNIQLPSTQTVSKEDVLDFLNILEFIIGEPNVDALSDYVKQQIEGSKLFDQLDLDYISHRMELYIKSWRQKNMKGEGWIKDTEKDQFLDDFIREFFKVGIKSISSNHIERFRNLITQFDIRFKNKLIRYFENSETIDTSLIIYSEEVFLTTLKIVNEMKHKQIHYFQKNDLLDSAMSYKVKKMLIDDVKSNTIVIINWDSQGPDERLNQILKDVIDKILIIVITNNDTIKLENFCKLNDKEISIQDIKNPEKILDISIECQGEKVPIKNFLTDVSLSKIVTTEVFKKLILNEPQCMVSENQDVSCYIPRTIVPSAFDEEILKMSENNNSELFVISGLLDERKRTELLRYSSGESVIFRDVYLEQYLEELRQEKPFKNIHWLEYMNNQYIWKNTIGSVTYLLNNKKDWKLVHNIQIKEEILMQCPNRLQILTGVAGLGKTASLNNIKKCYTQKHPFIFVKIINLHEKQSTLANLRKQRVQLQPAEFFCKLLTEENPLQQQLIKYGINKQNGMLILFDGYDEIQSNESRIYLCKNISRLVKIGTVNIIISSRTSLVQELEREYNVLAVSLQQFTSKNQVSFLIERSKNNVNGKTEDRTPYIEKIVENISGNHKEYSLIGIPLIIKMICDIFEDLISVDLSEFFNLVILYDYFTNAMYRRYFEEKESVSMEFVERMMPDGYENYYFIHQILSISLMLYNRKIENINKMFPEIQDRNQSNILNTVCNKGIVTHINGDDIRFIHQTFAEYFFAKFLFTNCIEEHTSSEQNEFILTKILCDTYFQNVRSFLNNLLHPSETQDYFNNNGEILDTLSLIDDQTVTIFFHIIYNCALENNENIFQIFIEKRNNEKSTFHISANSNDDFLYTVMLFESIKNNNTFMTMWILEHHTNQNRVDDVGRTPLHIASEYGSYEVLDTLIKHGLNVNQQNKWGFTPLHIAAENGHLETVKFLHENNADVNACSEDNVTPLFISAQNGHLQMVQFLAENHANVNACTKDNRTPLLIAAEKGHTEVVQYLKEIGADMNAGTKDNWTPLLISAQNGHIDVVKYLIENKADVNTCNVDNVTPLYLASQNGHLEVVRFLIENSANVNAYNENITSPLFIASQFGHSEVVKFLIENKADLMISDINNFSILHVASEYGHVAIVKLLLDNNAYVNACNKDDWTPLHLAAQGNCIEIMKNLIKNNKDKFTPLHIAVQNGHIEAMKLLYENNANVNASTITNWTPLNIALLKDHTEVAKFLIENNADVNACSGNSNFTPLHIATMNDHIEVVKMLKERNADVNACDAIKWTALHFAAENGNVGIVEFLIENNADVNACNKDNSTPLNVAAMHGHTEVVNILQDYM